jgi:hypothetical protein
MDLIALLNETLACTVDLWSQVNQASWNVRGKDFFSEDKEEIGGFNPSSAPGSGAIARGHTVRPTRSWSA